MAPSRESAKRQEIENLYPDLTFYFGLSPFELLKLPRWLKRIYVDALPRLIAGQQLRAIEAASFPYIEDSSTRDRITARWRKYMPDDEEPPGPAIKTKGDLRGLGALVGIGVVFEPKTEDKV